MEKEIRVCALQNAYRYEGRASIGSVIGALVQKNPDVKKNLKDLQKKIQKIVEEVNQLSLERQKKELERIDPSLLEAPEKKEERKGLKELPNVKEGKVVVRMEPSASGPLHIGHSYGLGLNFLYSQMYRGKLVFRIADTNPENVYKESYDLLEKDAQWLTGNKIKEVGVQSSCLERYYEVAEELVKKGVAYVCECKSEAFRELVGKKKACPCRDLDVKKQEERYKKLFSEYKEGEAVLRLKTDIDHKNPAMRDYPLMRVNTHEHPLTKKKYRVWPLMNLAVAVDDHDSGVTHALIGKDHRDNHARRKYLYEYLGWKVPEGLFWGRINFEGFKLSTSETRKAIEAGEYESWDDIRLPTLQAFKRRGYRPEALLQFAESMGLSGSDKSVQRGEFFKILDSFNRDSIDAKTDRYFLVRSPTALEVKDAPSVEVKLDLHPEHKKGGRSFSSKGKFFIEKGDFDRLEEGKVHRLMDCLNFEKKGKEFVFHSLDYESYRNSGKKGLIMHFVSDDFVDCEVLLDTGSLVKCYAEPGIKKVKKDEVIQAERFAFVKLDDAKKLRFWYLHR